MISYYLHIPERVNLIPSYGFDKNVAIYIIY